MRDTHTRSSQGRGCLEERVLDTWLDDAGPYLQLRLSRLPERTANVQTDVSASRRPTPAPHLR